MDKNKDKTQVQPQQPGQNIEISVNLDNTPILYTDNILMTTNEDGVVLDICQKLGSSNQARVVARIGMSRNHAKKFVKALGDLVEATEEGHTQTGKVHRA